MKMQMYPQQKPITLLYACLSIFMLAACGNEKSQPAPGPVIYKKDTAAVGANTKLKAPIINIIDTVTMKRVVLVVKDSAANGQRVGEKMAAIFDSILPAIIKEKKLTVTGAKMAWYRSSTKPFFFEAGFPVDKAPAGKLPKKVVVKNLPADSAVVAHFFGPYDLTYQAYEALTEWLKDRKKKRSGAAYEIYVGSTTDEKGKQVDPYRVQTDIVFPHK